MIRQATRQAIRSALGADEAELISGTRLAVIGDSTATEAFTVAYTHSMQPAIEWYSCGALTVENRPGAIGIAIGGADSNEAMNGAFITAGATFTGSVTGSTMTVTAVTSGTLAVQHLINGTGITRNSRIASQSSGTAGGAGEYELDKSSDATGSITIRSYSPANGSFMVDQTLESNADAALILLGANDIGGGYAWSEANFRTYYGAIISAVKGAGKRVLPMLPYPGGTQTAAGSGIPFDQSFSNYIYPAIIDMAATNGLRKIDLRPLYEDEASPGRWGANDRFGKSDGIHPPTAAYLKSGREVAAMFRASHDPTDQTALHTAVNSNPYLVTDLAALYVATNGGSIAYVPRSGGQPGERFADVTLNPTVHTFSAPGDNNNVVITSREGINVLVSFAWLTTGSVANTVATGYDYGTHKVVEITLRRTGSTIHATAAEVVLAIRADERVDSWVTAAYEGDGSGLVTATQNILATEISTVADIADADAPETTDYFRHVVELWRHPIEGWPSIGYLATEIRAYQPSYSAATGIYDGLVHAPIPEPIGNKMLLTTPWILNSAGRTRLRLRTFGLWFGTLRFGRMMIQKR